MHLSYYLYNMMVETGCSDFFFFLNINISETFSWEADSRPWAKLTHNMAMSSIDCKSLHVLYRSHDQIHEVKLSWSVMYLIKCRWLLQNVSHSVLKVFKCPKFWHSTIFSTVSVFRESYQIMKKILYQRYERKLNGSVFYVVK